MYKLGLLFCQALLAVTPTVSVATDAFIDVELQGQYHWELLFDIDNTNNTENIQREVKVVSDVTISYEDMVRSLVSSGSSMGFNMNGILEIINVGVYGELNSEVRSEYEEVSTSKQDFRKKTTKKKTFTIGPHSSLKMYRLVFRGPGINYMTDTLSTSARLIPDVPIEIRAKMVSMLKDIEVVYTDDDLSRPEDIIQDANENNPDINAGFGGKYVWLRPIWTQDISQGATGIHIVVQKNKNRNYSDLAKGAGGKYRYVKMLRDPNSKQRITEISLWRNSNNDPEPPTETGKCQFATQNINIGRKKDYLFLCWDGETV